MKSIREHPFFINCSVSVRGFATPRSYFFLFIFTFYIHMMNTRVHIFFFHSVSLLTILMCFAWSNLRIYFFRRLPASYEQWILTLTRARTHKHTHTTISSNCCLAYFALISRVVHCIIIIYSPCFRCNFGWRSIPSERNTQLQFRWRTSDVISEGNATEKNNKITK